MSPAATLSNLVKLDPSSARLVYAGLGLLAAATLALGWQTSPDAFLPLAGWIAGLGLLLTVLSHIVKAPMMRATLCWMVIVMIGVVQIYVISAMFPHSLIQRFTGRVAPLECMLRGQFDISHCLDDLAPAVTPSAYNLHVDPGPDTTVWFAQSPSAPPGTTVFLQYGEPVQRAQTIDIGNALLAQGWGIQGADKGGEWVKGAPEGNEVRYFNAEDEAAAQALAQAVAPLAGGVPFAVRDLSRLYGLVKPGQMEIWVTEARPPGIDG